MLSGQYLVLDCAQYRHECCVAPSSIWSVQSLAIFLYWKCALTLVGTVAGYGPSNYSDCLHEASAALPRCHCHLMVRVDH